jgi:hypothetical protein
MSLKVILDLVGDLDDSEGPDTGRTRFWNHLNENVKEVGQIRDYVDECVRSSGDLKYNRALQDLVTHVGHFLGFAEVIPGRYQGVQGKTSYDGLWKSPTGFSIVLEVKTSERYYIKTATLLHYIDDLISDKKISDRNHALGLYVVGRPDDEIPQLETTIRQEGNSERLRIISVDSLLSLAEIMDEYELEHEDILSLLLPTPKIDAAIELMKSLTTESPKEPQPPISPQISPEISPLISPPREGDVSYWLVPVGSDEELSAEEEIKRLIGSEPRVFAFGERTPGRNEVKPNDMVCFYASTTGVVAHAKVTSRPEKKPHPKIRHPEEYPYTFTVSEPQLYLDNPVVIDSACRSRLQAFQNRDPNKAWGLFVRGMHRLFKHDFDILTRIGTAV